MYVHVLLRKLVRVCVCVCARACVLPAYWSTWESVTCNAALTTLSLLMKNMDTNQESNCVIWWIMFCLDCYDMIWWLVFHSDIIFVVDWALISRINCVNYCNNKLKRKCHIKKRLVIVSLLMNNMCQMPHWIRLQ